MFCPWKPPRPSRFKFWLRALRLLSPSTQSSDIYPCTRPRHILAWPCIWGWGLISLHHGWGYCTAGHFRKSKKGALPFIQLECCLRQRHELYLIPDSDGGREVRRRIENLSYEQICNFRTLTKVDWLIWHTTSGPRPYLLYVLCQWQCFFRPWTIFIIICKYTHSSAFATSLGGKYLYRLYKYH